MHDDVEQYVTYPNAEQNGYGILSNGDTGTSHPGPTWTLKMLITGALKNSYSVSAGDLIKTQQEFEDGEYQVRALVRGILKKMPYFYFSDYATVKAHPSYLISTTQYALLMQQAWVKFPEYYQHWKENYANDY